MKEFFELLSIMDWITPAKGFVEDIINDPTLLQSNSWTFFIPYDQSLESGWNARGVQKLMKQHGIKTWGSQITGGEFFFSVKQEQAQWAEYLLNQNSIPLSPLSQGAPRVAKSGQKQRDDAYYRASYDATFAIEHHSFWDWFKW